jgi:cation-transporting ATPase E
MVRALQLRGHTVAMTGDGVNDVLALKDADCGVAMASGSEATRSVAQLVLMDSNFAALPSVVAEGRRVINNIERVASLFLTKTAYSMVLSVITGVFAINYPLRPIHLTLLSWFTIGIPAFFLALEPNSDRVNLGFLKRVLSKAVPAGVVIALLTMGVFAIVRLDDSIDTDHARTIAVMVAGSVALMNLYRVARPLNALRATLVVAMVAFFVLMFLLPFGRDLFELDTTAGWAYGLGFGAIAIAYPLLVLGAWLSDRIWASPYWAQRRARKAAASS